jgi:hypothetical protein
MLGSASGVIESHPTRRTQGWPRPRESRSRPVLNPTLQLSAVVEVSRRRVGRRRVEVTDDRIVRFLLSRAARGGPPPRLAGALRQRLLADGILIRPSAVPRRVHLDPRLRVGSGGSADIPGSEACSPHLTARCTLHRGPSPPLGVGPQRLEPFLPREEILWVFDRGSRIALPYTLAPKLVGAVRGLLQGRAERSRYRRAAIAALHRARGLADPHEAAGRARVWRRQVQIWRQELRTHGYVALLGLFPPIFLDALCEYYRRLESEGYLPAHDPGRRGAPLLYDEPLLCFLGAQLASVVRQVTRARVSWTFSYLRPCGPGSVLARHRDAPVCRWNVDLVVGGNPSPDRRRAWPLWVDGRSGPRPIRLGLGDGLLYRGALLPHWRTPQPRSNTTMLGCLHYGTAQ